MKAARRAVCKRVPEAASPQFDSPQLITGTKLRRVSTNHAEERNGLAATCGVHMQKL
jgi:hypothetical protein